jgi:uncharacterized damage-inducible protein DinB
MSGGVGGGGPGGPLPRLLEHLAWADGRVLEALRAAADPPAEALELFAHVLGAERVWLARLREEASPVAVWPALSLEQCGALSAEVVAGLRALVAAAGPEQLARPVPYRNSAGRAFTSTVEEMLLQVVLHGCYHRGQIALLLRQHGGEPATSDFIAFARGAPAATRADRPGDGAG